MARVTPTHLVIGGLLLTGTVLAGRVAVPRRQAVPAPAQAPGQAAAPVTPSTPPEQASRPAVTNPLIDRCLAAIYKEVPARRFSPVASRALATALVTVCAEQHYPLDLAFGHAFAESRLDVNAVNRGSGAAGPLQVTPPAAAQVHVPWPLATPAAKVRAGVQYMSWLRATYPECAASVRTTLRHYGMGRGNWRRYDAGQLTCASTLSVARAELGCPGVQPYTATILAIARRHPELKTTAWWGGSS